VPTYLAICTATQRNRFNSLLVIAVIRRSLAHLRSTRHRRRRLPRLLRPIPTFGQQVDDTSALPVLISTAGEGLELAKNSYFSLRKSSLVATCVYLYCFLPFLH